MYVKIIKKGQSTIGSAERRPSSTIVKDAKSGVLNMTLTGATIAIGCAYVTALLLETSIRLDDLSLWFCAGFLVSISILCTAL